MVFWCPTCGAFLGLRDPVTNWSIKRNLCCPACVSNGWPKRKGAISLEPIESDDDVVNVGVGDDDDRDAGM
jgi:hypothetical protein